MIKDWYFFESDFEWYVSFNKNKRHILEINMDCGYAAACAQIKNVVYYLNILIEFATNQRKKNELCT